MSRHISRLQRTCAICACSDLLPCNDRGIPCYWITANLCSACCRSHCPSIFDHTLDPRQRQGIANAAIRLHKLIRTRALKQARASAHVSSLGSTGRRVAPATRATLLEFPGLDPVLAAPRYSSKISAAR